MLQKTTLYVCFLRLFLLYTISYNKCKTVVLAQVSQRENGMKAYGSNRGFSDNMLRQTL